MPDSNSFTRSMTAGISLIPRRTGAHRAPLQLLDSSFSAPRPICRAAFPTSFRGRHRKDNFSRMMAKKFESCRFGERIEFPNESDNLPDLVIGKKIAPGEHRGVSDAVLHDPEHFVIGI